MKLSACFFILFSVLISYQSIFPGANAAHSYRGRNVFNMTAQLYGSGTSNLPDPVTVPHGGTGDTSLTQYGVLVGAGTNSVQVTAAGATGTVLIGTTGANPSFSDDIVVSNIATTTGTITSAPIANDDIVNKAYVDLFVAGLTVKSACVAGTTGPLTVTCSGMTLTNAGAMAAFSIDGVSPTVGQRVLIKDQATQAQNGVYTVTTVGSGAVNWVLTRASDFDTTAEVFPGVIVPVTTGTMNAHTLWLQTATVTTIGCAGDPIVFATFIAPGIQTLDADTGSATGTTVTIAGGNNIATSASGSTLTIDVDGTTQYAVQVGSAAGALNSVSPSATSGVPLISQGAAANPAFGTAVVAGGGTGVATMTTAYAPVCAGTTATGPLQVASTGLSTANFVLTSNGSGALPSFQDVSAAGAIKTITGNTGGALSGSNINIVGGTTGLTFAGSGTTETLTGTLIVGNGGTGVATMTTAYAPVCAGTTATGPLQVASTGLATANFVLTSNGSGALPSFQDVSAAGAIKTITGNTGGALSGSNINIVGGTTGLTFAGSGTTETLTGTLIVGNGGTGVATMTTAYAPVCAGTTATGPLQVASTGLATANFVLTSNGSGALPSFQDVSAAGAIKTITGNTGGALSGSNINIVGGTTGLTFAGSGTTETLTGTLIVGNGGTGVATMTAYALLAGGTTSTNPVQSLTTGTSGQVLTSNGSAALPTWSDASAVGVSTTTVTLTNAQIKALRATPIQLVAAPGSGKVVYVLSCMVKLNYGGTSAFTAAASQTLAVAYTTTPSTGVSIIAAAASNALITATATQVLGTINGGQDLTNYSNVTNQPVYIYNTVATEISGNAGNDNTMTVVTTYQTLTI